MIYKPAPSLFKRNRDRLLSILRPSVGSQNTAVVLQGGKSKTSYTTDTDLRFRQESNFFYLTGLHAPDSECALRVSTGELVVFVPFRDAEYAMWCGAPPSNEEFKTALGADRVMHTGDLQKVLAEWETQKVLTIPEFQPEGIDAAIEVDTSLYTPMTQSRLIKNEEEIEAMRQTAIVNAKAHIALMEYIKPGVREFQVEAEFVGTCMKNGARYTAYIPICGAGTNAAILHYGSEDVELKDGQMILIDAGAELGCFTSDITRSLPVNGKFTEDQKLIYNIVLKMQQAVLDAMKPGVQWVDMHLLSERVLAEELLAAGFLQGDLQEILDLYITAIFYPHGLGHSLGLDTHDPPNRDGSFKEIDRPGIRNLRFHGVMEKGMVMTVEPGMYFIKAFIDAAFADPKISKYLVKEKIDKFRDFGGVRIEDNVVVTDDGIENLSHAIPKTVEEVEKAMSAKH